MSTNVSRLLIKINDFTNSRSAGLNGLTATVLHKALHDIIGRYRYRGGESVSNNAFALPTEQL